MTPFMALARRLFLVCIAASLLAIGSAQAQVTGPIPADRSTNVSTTTALTWTADPKATRYDVYLGTTNPPALVARNQSATSYQPAPLSPARTYYWRVDSRGSKNYSATGTVWSFTTGTPPPSAPTGASPSSGSSQVAVGTALSWSPSANATSYDVRLGTSTPPPLVSSGQTATSYQPAPLAYAQTYYWQVTARGAGGTTAGPVWTFTTASPPPSTPRDRLRLLTWNVQSGRDSSGTSAVDAQVSLLAASGADVIALQEVTNTAEAGDLTVLYKSKLESATGVPWYQVWAPAPRAANYAAEGNVLLSRIPIVTSATTQFDTVPSDPSALDAKRSAASIGIVVNDVLVTVLTTELPIDALERQKQLDLFQTWTAGFQAPRVIGGDFNMLPGDSTYADMAAAFTDAWPGLAGPNEYGYTNDVRTVAPYQPARSDYWFQEPSDAHARATEIYVVKTTRSDHHAVVIDVDVK